MTEATFVEAYSDGVKRTIAFLRGRGLSIEDALDTAQSAWVRGWEKLDQLRDDTLLVFWINTIALNEYRRILRTAKREVPWKTAYWDIPTTAPNGAEIEIQRILQASKPKDRQLLKAQMQGSTAKELAQIAGGTATAMRIRLYRARRRARDLLEVPRKSASQAA